MGRDGRTPPQDLWPGVACREGCAKGREQLRKRAVAWPAVVYTDAMMFEETQSVHRAMRERGRA